MKIRHFSIYFNLILGLAFMVIFFSFSSILTETSTNDWIDKSHGLSGKFASALAINPKNPNTIYVAMYEGGIFKSIDGGETWILKNKGISTSDDKQIISLTIDPSNPNILYAGTDTAKVFRSLDEGETWQIINKGIQRGTVFYCKIFSIKIGSKNPSNLYAATSTGAYYSNDRGDYWERIGYRDEGLDNVFNMDMVVDFSNPHTLYTASQKGVFKSIDHGKKWTFVGPENSYVQCLMIDPINPNRIFAGTNQGLLVSMNGGKDWRGNSLKSERTNSVPSVKSLYVNPFNSQEIYAATNTGIYYSANAGEKWKELLPKKRMFFWGSNDLAINFSSPITIYSAGNGYRDKPGGFVWKYTFSEQ